MNPVTELLTRSDLGHLAFARVVSFDAEQQAADVALHKGSDAPVSCRILQTADSPSLRLGVDDDVLVLLMDGGKSGIVLGRLSPSNAPQDSGSEDEIVLEARKSLTLKCGEGSITIREDGKILIKGKDLVSRAKRLNRIKGAAVSIN